MSKTFCIGDVHGAHKALVQCLERSNFDYENDTLICLGDVADGWSEVPECVEELLKIKNLIYVCGNHDRWAKDWFKYGATHYLWISQGGQATIDAYVRTGLLVDERHRNFWLKVEDRLFYHDEERDYLFVHGGYNWHYPVIEQPKAFANNYSNLYWDRHLWDTAWATEKRLFNGVRVEKPRFMDQYTLIFIGHTTTTFTTGDTLPVKALNVYNLDQGAGYEGKLTIMDIDSKEFWQSDLVNTLYPNERGRN